MSYLKTMLWLVIPVLFSQCTVDEESPAETEVKNGLRPVYLSYDEMRQITSSGPRALQHPGKIYVRGRFLFINETGQGIHIIDNQNPATPQNMAFLSIPGNVDMAVKGNVLYADNTIDLVALDISNPLEVKLLKRVQNTFPYQSYPSQTGVQFECADPAKGVVIRWESATLQNPQCYR